MGKISINELKPGMELLEDVKEKRGMILLAAGQMVSEKSLAIFQRFGITEVNIAGIDQGEVMTQKHANLKPEYLQELEKKARDFFRHTHLNHPAIKELYQLYLSRNINLHAEQTTK